MFLSLHPYTEAEVDTFRRQFEASLPGQTLAQLKALRVRTERRGASFAPDVLKDMMDHIDREIAQKTAHNLAKDCA